MEPIAIVGMGCVFPGADSPDAFWANLLAGTDTTSLATRDDMGVDPALLYDPARGRRDRYYSLRGGFVRGFRLDPWGLRLPASRLEALDPLFGWTLHAARAALADGRYLDREDTLAGCGLILGNLCFPTRASSRLFAPVYARAVEAGLSTRLGRDVGQLDLPGEGEPSVENLRLVSLPADITAEALGLGGPRFALDAACASSLYAIRLACDRLASGESDLMLAGAVSGADPLFIHMGFSIFQAYPEQDGGSRPLDAGSSGLVSGQGAGFVALRRYADALRDGDRIHAVIRGIGLSNDGAGKHLLVPNPRGQRLALERAYDDAGLSPDTVAYVECHATGTPVGDMTELDTMAGFFGEDAPLVGSVKSNFGHLLTAAGMASVLKTTLALGHGTIPPTIGVQEPLGPRVVRQTTPWPEGGDGPRRAGVSAFGFGGTNAHLVLEEPGGAPVRPARPSRSFRPLAIVGMAARFGSLADLEELDQALYDGRADRRPPPVGRWNGIDGRPDLLTALGLSNGAPAGGYVDSFDLDFLRPRVPPDSGDRPIPQQLLLFDVADRAAREAGLRPGTPVAVVVAVEAEQALHRFRGRVDLDWQLPALLETLGVTAEERAALVEEAKDALHGPAQVNQYVSFIGNVIACRVASRWDFNGPALTVSAGEASAFRALEVARDLLTSGEVEAVVLGAVDLAAGLEAVLARAWTDGDGGAYVGEGAGAIVLRRAEDAGPHTYAAVESVAVAQAADGAAAQALATGGVTAADIGYLELSAAGTELRDLARAYGGNATCAAGSAAHVVGDTGAASGIAGLIHAALCLSGRRQPPSPELRDDSTWRTVPRAYPWLRPDGTRRLAAVSGIAADGPAAHVVLAEGTPPPPGAGLLGRRSRLRLLPVCAADPASLERELTALARRLEAGTESFDDVAAARLDALERDAELPIRVVLLAAQSEQAAHEVRLALAGVPAALASGTSWETPLGSCFTPNPLGAGEEAVAFVYPGAFSAYPGLGDDLLQLFPALHEQLAERASDPADILGDRLLRPRSRCIDEEAAKVALRADAVAMIQAGTTYALATTGVLRDWFRVGPAAAFGYSMGEGSMIWALGVWRAGDEARRRLHASPLFKTRLVGPCEAVAPHVHGEWASVIAAAPAADVEARVADEPQVWITHVHTPREVVLGGREPDVRRVVESLSAEWFPAPVRAAIHCPAMASEHDDLVALHRLPVVETPPVRFYTAADYNVTSVDSERLAQNIALATCRRMDFVRLVERVWGDGARVFVELGPGAACTRWIGEILDGRDHAALSVDRRGVDDATGLLRALARLVAERVPVCLDALRRPETAVQAEEAGVVRTVSLCGRDLIPFSRRGVLDHKQLLAFAGGRIADAFGPEYASIDAFRRRVRLPMPPYLLVSRVTALDGRRGVFEPCSVTTEYDVPRDAWYTVDGQVPIAVAVEAGQCDLLLISYLGIDFEARGERVYRLLDCTLTFRDALPLEGDTLRYEIRIKSFARTGETVLFFFEYDCYVGDRLVLEMRDGCAGFFTDAELAEPRGVVDSREYLAARVGAEPTSFEAPARCTRRQFDADDLRRLGEGDLAGCFGRGHDAQGRNPSLRLPPEAMRMIDRVVDVDPAGGAWGLGLLEAEKDLAPDDWFFPCHFQGDEVLAGSLMADGCSQLLQFYLLYLGLHTGTVDARFQPVAGVSQRVVCRGQVTPEVRRLVYRMEITSLDGGASSSARANCDILVDGRTVVRFTDLALELAEKAVPSARPLYDEEQVHEFTLGSVTACFGPEFAVHDGRRVPRTPNGDLQLLTRVVDASARGARPEPGAWLVSEYDVPDEPWFVRENAYPVTPYSVLMEIALQPCGFLSAHQGTSLIDPQADLYFRNLDGTGHLHGELDLRGRTVRARTEMNHSTALSGVILQRFTFALECDGETFFDGEASFGYFEGAALAEQVGLDGGRRVPAWLAGSGLEPAWVELGDGSPLLVATRDRPHERLAGPQLQLLDRAAVVPDGGKHGLGYVYAEQDVDTSSWYFPCHFYLDPVMPGSLGVEAIVEVLQCLALRSGLTQPFRSPRFGHASGIATVWKYRGQIVEGAGTMAVEAHVTDRQALEDEVILLAEASLWCDGLRIYEVTDLSLRIAEAAHVPAGPSSPARQVAVR